MTNEKFMLIFEDIFSRCRSTLEEKKEHYGPGKDRLVQFKNAASLTHTTPIEALCGMMVKHTTSIYELIAKHSKGKRVVGFSMKSIWMEKIIDHINYHILLFALLDEECSSCKSGNGTVDEVKPNEKLKL